MDIACFCGERFSFVDDLGVCPTCGEYAGPVRVSDVDAAEINGDNEEGWERGRAAEILIPEFNPRTPSSLPPLTSA